MNSYTSSLLVCMLFTICTYAQMPQAIPHDDLIASIPGLDQMPTFNMHSGFLTAGRDPKKVFYWLNEATEWDNKILLVWLNGGPGCSSLQGLFQENGPFTFNEETEKLEPNPFSWNRFAHTLYLEVPFNTGFSHFADDRVTNSTDHNVASNLLKTLENLMEEHPRYRTYDIFLAGQSYAGIYIPTLAVRITELNSTLAANFKGIILGNPYLSEYLNEKTRATFAYTHGYLGDELYTFLQKYDCYNKTATASYDDYMKKQCDGKINEVGRTLFNQPMNPYNIEKQCWRTKASDIENQLAALLANYNTGGEVSHDEGGVEDQFANYFANYGMEKESEATPQAGNESEEQFANLLANYGEDENEATTQASNDSEDQSANLLADYETETPEETEPTTSSEQFSLTLVVTCEHKSPGLEKFLSRVDVQTAIHAGDRGAWKMCSDKVFYSHHKRYTDMTGRIRKLVKQHKKSVLLYFGDLDLACNVYGGREFVRGLGFKASTDNEPFLIEYEGNESLGGFVQQYENLLTFAVVKGAGHSAPTDKPAECYSLVSKWILQNTK